MAKLEKVEKVLKNFGDDILENRKLIINEFGDLFYKDNEKQTLLHIFCDALYDEEKCFKAIEILLRYGPSPNTKDDYSYIFIQTALYSGYSENFVLKIINEALKYDLNVNHIDDDGDTIIHTAIYSDDYRGDVDKMYELLCENGFDSTIRNTSDKDIIDSMKDEDKFTDAQIKKMKKLVNANVIDQKDQWLLEKELPKFEKFGKVLNVKKYLNSPTVGREKELKNLIVTLAQEKKYPIIVGESGVGKTALAEELVYRIKTKEVPKFLRNKIILEINPAELVAGCQYVGQFEKKLKELMDLCDNDYTILFIDEIHTMYGVGSYRNNGNDMASMLRHYLDRGSFKIIGTTTKEEYNKYFSNSSFKRRFEKISLEEPDKEVLYQILDKVIDDYCNKNNLNFKDLSIKKDIVNIIIESTSKKGRIYDDPLCNPDLAISLIDKAFAFALVYDGEFINKEHFIESFKSNDRIYKSRCEEAIKKLEDLKEKSNLKLLDKKKEKSKIIKFDFNGYKK